MVKCKECGKETNVVCICGICMECNEEKFTTEERIKRLESSLMLLGINGLAYSPLWQEQAKKLEQLKRKQKEEEKIMSVEGKEQQGMSSVSIQMSKFVDELKNG